MFGTGREWCAFLALVALVGGALGIGCEKGCAYVRRHVTVEWSP
jgi:hypothetical protein